MSESITAKIRQINHNIEQTRKGIPVVSERMETRQRDMQGILRVMLASRETTEEANESLLTVCDAIDTTTLNMYAESLVELQNQIKIKKAMSLLPYILHISGKPTYQIHDTNPFITTEFGHFRNKSPNVEGEFTLHSLSFSTEPYDTLAIYFNCTTEENPRSGYGFHFSSWIPSNINTFNNIASHYGVDVSLSDTT